MEQTNETINNSVNTEEGKEEQADTMGFWINSACRDFLCHSSGGLVMECRSA